MLQQLLTIFSFLICSSHHSQAAFLTVPVATPPLTVLASCSRGVVRVVSPRNTMEIFTRIDKTADRELHAAAYPRRKLIQNIVALCASSFVSDAANADVIRSGRCANGEGDGCETLADGNGLIQNLQRKSLENKEENQREALYAYYMKNYPDVFAISDKRMVMRADKSFALFSPDEVKDMIKSGMIKIEYPTTKGGRVADLTQKPVFVMVD